MKPRLGAFIVAMVFFIAMIPLAGVRTLWLDEILQLIETRQPSVAQLIADVPRNMGAAPLGYLVQQASLKLTGYSLLSARLPSAVFASASVFAVGLLAARLGLRRPWVAAALFAVLPLTVRYATESRVYSQALFCSLLATVLFVELRKRPSWLLAGAYGLALTATAWTQAYGASVGFAHVLWAIAQRQPRAALQGTMAIAFTVLAFLPWYNYSKERWAAGIGPEGFHFAASWKTPLMLFREVAGGGYWVSGLLLIVCCLAIVRRGSPLTSAHTLLLLLIAVPAISVFSADAILNYFLAARQFLWILPAVAILAAMGVERYRRAGVALAAVLSGVCVWQSSRYFLQPQERWEHAARSLAIETGRGACFTIAAPAHISLYRFFQPRLRDGSCDATRMILAVTPYSSREQRQAAIASLLAAGYLTERETVQDGFGMVRFRRAP